MVTSQADPTSYPQNNRSTEDSFARLLVQHQRLLFVYLRTILNSSVDAEEVLQETFIVLWSKRDKFVIGTNFINWAMTVAQYEVRKFRRSRKHVPHVLDDDVLVQMTSEIAVEHGLADARQSALDKCLQTLNEREQAIVKAAYGVNATKKKDAGLRLGMTPSNFCQALHRLRQRLLKCIQYRLRTEELA